MATFPDFNECPRGDRRCDCAQIPGGKWRQCWERARREERTIMTGFTLELDGDPEHVQTMLKAVWKAFEAEVQRWNAAQPQYLDTLSGPVPIRIGGPFHGTVTLRTKELSDVPA